jgi:hypothetical protein
MFRSKRKIRRSNKSSLLGVAGIIVILISFLLHFTNERQQEQIIDSYCGEFGYYGKGLTLMKDSTFRFNYYGCSTNHGYLDGNWKIEGNHLLFYPSSPNENLDSEYIRMDNKLISVNLKNENFILCKDYTNHIVIE